MKDYSEMEFHPLTENIVEAMCKKIPTAPKHMFRTLLGYYMCKMSSTMRVDVVTEIRGTIPVNAFLFNLAPSGVGKNYSTNTLIEEGMLEGFKQAFLETVLPEIANKNIAKLAVKRAKKNREDPDTVKTRVINEYESLGQMRFSFSKATPAAIQQLRQQMLIAGAGSLNLEIDEIGLNLIGSSEALIPFLELFDVGKTKESITKNTRENARIEEIDGVTPANFLAFGTPCKVYDGNKVEECWMDFNETGFARRSWHSYVGSASKVDDLTGAEKYAIQSSTELNDVFIQAKQYFEKLAILDNFKKQIFLPKPVGIALLDYETDCKRRARPFIDSQEMIRAEMEHRYFKVLKMAGAYAFVDGNTEISMDNLNAAIKLAEDSGKSFYAMMHQEPPYAKMARYIANIAAEVTQADLIETLSYYKGSAAVRRDMITNSIAWGYKNHIVISQYMQDGVEFFKGSTLEKTNLDELKIAYSTELAEGYENALAPFKQLADNLLLLPGYHWINHLTINSYRSEDTLQAGFNMVVLDCDGGVQLNEAHHLLRDFVFLTQTTKRHTNEANRFRLIMPLNYEMVMSKDEYTIFMKNLYEWLPFDVDTGTFDRCRKWLTNEKAECYYSTGNQLLDARLFIPKTKKNDERKQLIIDYAGLSNLERWFVTKSSEGNRNNQLIRYAMLLVDLGHSVEDIRTKVIGMNSGLPDKLKETEIDATVMLTVAKAVNKKEC